MEKIKTFLKNEWSFLAIALFGLVLKLLFLDTRPLHHDESLHAQYGKYFAQSFSHGFYKYNPLLHGPLLYNIQGFWTWLVGPLSKFGVRIIPVMLGFLLSLSPLLFKKFTSRTSLLFISVVLAISPSFTYWSRFLRHDLLVLFSLTLIGWLWIRRPKYWTLYLGMAAGAHFATKENFFVHLILIGGYLITENIMTKKLRLPTKKNLTLFLIGFVVISVPLYSAWFQYSPGFFDALYRKSLLYWLQQHQMERIKGPFYFNGLIMSIYDTWLIPIIFILAFQWLRIQKRTWLIVDLSLTALFFLLAYSATPPLPQFISTWLKIKTNLDIFVFLISVYAAFRTTLSMLSRREYSLAFWSYCSFASFFTYSYLGEKVPWLALYPTMAFAILCALSLKRMNKKSIVACFTFLVLCLPKTIYVNFVAAGAASELISQVHTTPVYENLALRIKTALESPPGHIKPRVLILEDNGWPLSWYLWGLGGVDYSASESNWHNYDFIFDKLINSKLSSKLHTSFDRQVIPMRHYWWPNFADITFKRWLKLVFFHQPWSATGDFKVVLWRKKEGFFNE